MSFRTRRTEEEEQVCMGVRVYVCVGGCGVCVCVYVSYCSLSGPLQGKCLGNLMRG